MKKLITGVLYFLLIILFFAGFITPNIALTQDLGRHLLLGELIFSSFSIPRTNLFSYTHSDFPFVNHHYLSEVIFYLSAKVFGIESLALITIICMFIGCLILFLYAKKEATPIALTIVSLLFLRIIFERVDVRPEMFSFLLMSLTLVLLFIYRKKTTKWILLLIPLTFIWTQLHIYFFVGILIQFLFLLDGIIIRRKHPFVLENRLLFITLLLSFLVTLINPNGIDGTLYPLRVFNNYGYSIEENQTVFFLQSLGFQKPSLPYFQFSALILFLTFSLSFRRTRPIDWLLAITFTIAGFLAVRNLPLFALACFIPFTRSLTQIQVFLYKPKLTTNSNQKFIFPLTSLLLICVLLWQISTVSHLRGFGLEVKDPYKRATDFFIQNNLEGPILNNFDNGSYLIYSLYPREQVFVDGRPEAYPKEFLQSVYIPLQENPELFEITSRRYKFNSIIFSHTDQTPWAQTFLSYIIKHPNWVPVYLDSSTIILVKKDNKNQKIINKFGMNNETLSYSGSPQDFQSLLQEAHFANLINNPLLEKKTYKKLLKINPDFCPALQNLSIILSHEKDPTAVIYINRYQNTCI